MTTAKERRSLRWFRKSYTALRAMEKHVLVGGVVIVGCLWAFHEIAERALSGSAGFDERVFNMLRDTTTGRPLGPDWLPAVMRDFTALGSGATVLLVMSIVSLGLFTAGHKRLATIGLVACLSGLALGPTLKHFFVRDRPGAEFRRMETFSTSFPSGHTMNAAVVYLTLGALVAQGQKRRVASAFALATGIGLALLVGLSRVYLGVHWPTDVLGGLAAGFGWATLCWVVAHQIRRRKPPEPAPPAEVAPA